MLVKTTGWFQNAFATFRIRWSSCCWWCHYFAGNFFSFSVRFNCMIQRWWGLSASSNDNRIDSCELCYCVGFVFLNFLYKSVWSSRLWDVVRKIDYSNSDRNSIGSTNHVIHINLSRLLFSIAIRSFVNFSILFMLFHQIFFDTLISLSFASARCHLYDICLSNTAPLWLKKWLNFCRCRFTLKIQILKSLILSFWFIWKCLKTISPHPDGGWIIKQTYRMYKRVYKLQKYS